MKLISKSREGGVIFIVRLIRKVTHWISKFVKAKSSSCLYVYEKVSERFWRTNTSYNNKAPALLCALTQLKHNGLYMHTKHCTVKHSNNFIEQDHRHIKRRLVKSAGFQNLRHASRTIKGIETIHLYTNKKEVIFQPFLFRRIRNYRSYSEPL